MVGVGVMAEEGSGGNPMGGHISHEPTAEDTNVYMGGSNFGINITSWDDCSGVDAGGRSDWDN